MTQQIINNTNNTEQSLVLLHGFRLFMECLLDAEAGYLCGANRFENTSSRLNYRRGHHMRKIRTHLGCVPVRVPHLRYIHVRVSMCKRATRLEAEIIKTLSQIQTDGITRECVSDLIKKIWTVSLTENLLSELVLKCIVLLEAWRAAFQLNGNIYTYNILESSENTTTYGSAETIIAERCSPKEDGYHIMI